MQNVWLQLIITVGAILGGVFSAYRYTISQSAKREKVFIDFIKEMQDTQLEYYTTKNGHLERISETFAKTIDKNTRALDKLSARIKDNKHNGN